MRRQSMRSARKQQLLRILQLEIKGTRETKYQSSINDHYEHCAGMIHAALILAAITENEYDRLMDLAINAASRRRMEQERSPYTGLPAPAWRATA